MKLGISLVCTLIFGTCIAVALADQGDDEKKAKHSIKEVMKNAHKDGLLKKVLSEDASAEEKLVLLDHDLSLLDNKPPKGDEDAWHQKTGAVVLAAAKVAVGRDGALKELKTATNCGACHKAHKGS